MNDDASCVRVAAAERIWHIEDSQGQILTGVFRLNLLIPLRCCLCARKQGVNPVPNEAGVSIEQSTNLSGGSPAESTIHHDLASTVSDLGLIVHASGIRVQFFWRRDLGFGVEGSGFRLQVSGFVV